MNWDDLRIIAAVRDEGTFAGAGLSLRIDETTVARRLARVERALGFRLFQAADGVRRPTQQCEAVIAHVQAMARHAAEIGTVGEAVPGPVGEFRVASTHVTAEEILAPRAGDLLAEHPGLDLVFLTSNENVNFSRWEADVAIRLRKPDKGDFVISQLAELRFYLVEPAEAPDGAPIVCAYPQDLDFTPEALFLKAKGFRKARCVTDNVRVIRRLIETRRAVGVLPEYMCRDLIADPRWRLTLVPTRREAWLLVQNHLRDDQAARLVIDWIRECFREFRGR